MTSHKIYLAARYSRYPEMQGYARELEARGYAVTARWIWGSHDVEIEQTLVDNHGQKYALEDIEDLLAADTLISFTEPPGQQQGRARGGRHVEFGIAIGLRLATEAMRPTLRVITPVAPAPPPPQRLVVVGPRENPFHHIPILEVHETFEEALDAEFPPLLADGHE